MPERIAVLSEFTNGHRGGGKHALIKQKTIAQQQEQVHTYPQIQLNHNFFPD